MIGLQQRDGTMNTGVAAHVGGQLRPGAAFNSRRRALHAPQPHEADDQRQHAHAGSSHPDRGGDRGWARGKRAPPGRRGDERQRHARLAPRFLGDAPRARRRPSEGGLRARGHRKRDLPPGDEQRQDRCGRGPSHRDREHPMARGRRSPAQQERSAERDQHQQRDFDRRVDREDHRFVSFFAFATSAAIRSSSSSDSRAASPPRSAPTTFSVEPSKNVSTRCRSAERRAVWRASAGR